MGFATFWATYSAGLPDFLTQLTNMKKSNNYCQALIEIHILKYWRNTKNIP
jgi:hypothetical protein